MDMINSLIAQIMNLIQENKMIAGVLLLALVYFFFMKPKMQGFSGGQTMGPLPSKRY